MNVQVLAGQLNPATVHIAFSNPDFYVTFEGK